MANPTSQPAVVYRKLTGLHRSIGLMSQLWLGDDHLLHVTSTGYTESYRRSYLRDIQSMLIVHTARRMYIAVMLVLLMMGAAAIMSIADSGVVGYSILGGIFSIFFIWNYVRGAGCRVVVITAVQQEKVPSLSRLPKTRRIIAQLKPLIEAAQTDLVQAPASSPVLSVPPPVPEYSSQPPPLPPT